MEKKKILIIGCGRSGTYYTARVCRALGLDMAHERDFDTAAYSGKDGIASWFLAVDDPHPPFGPEAAPDDFMRVIHQVRHPLKVIPSFAQFILRTGKKSPAFLQKHLPYLEIMNKDRRRLPADELLYQAAQYWYYWNLLAEYRAHETVQVERLEHELPRICDDIRADYRPEAMMGVSRQTNSRRIYMDDRPWEIDWNFLELLDSDLCYRIKKLAERYGYEI
jgi:hypothetical protein